MRLNMDCVRDILLACESFGPEHTPVMVGDIASVCKNEWNTLDLKYTISRMCEGHLISGMTLNGDAELEQQVPAIFSITWDGHQFLEKIRDEKTWAKTKTALTAVRNYSLSAISAIAEGITTAAINAYLSGLN